MSGSAPREVRPRKRVLVAVVATFLVGWGVAGCEADSPRGIATESDSAGIRIVTSERPLEAWTLADEPDVDLGSVNESGPTNFFQVEAAAFLPNERFVVANRSTEELRYFGTDGSFLGAAGRPGRGPGEFRGLSWIAVAGDSLLAYDWGNDRISVRGPSGSYSRSFRLEWTSGLLTPELLMRDGTLLALSVRAMTELHRVGTQVDLGLLSRHDLTGAMIDSVGRLPVSQRVVHREGGLQTTVPLPLSASASFAPTDSGFCYAYGPEFQLGCFDLAGTWTSIARVDSLPRAVEPEDVDRAFDHELERAREANNVPREQALLRARPSMIVPDHLPAFTDLVSDDEGRLWARRYALPDETRTDWWIFQDGRWVARLETDVALDVMDVREDRLLALWRDELGVERIRIYRIEQP